MSLNADVMTEITLFIIQNVIPSVDVGRDFELTADKFFIWPVLYFEETPPLDWFNF